MPSKLCFITVSCWFLACLSLRTWRWRRHVPPKRWSVFNELHVVISQKTEFFITTAVRTSNTASVSVMSQIKSPHSMLRANKKGKIILTVLKTYVYVGLLCIKYLKIRTLCVISVTLISVNAPSGWKWLCLTISITRNVGRYHSCVVCRLDATILNNFKFPLLEITSFSSCSSNYMFRPSWPSSGVSIQGLLLLL
jgi:hypothetical protein